MTRSQNARLYSLSIDREDREDCKGSLRESALALIVLVVFMSISGMAGCSSRSNDKLTLLIGGDTAGWITPCGCAANQSGGLARRATLIRNVESDAPSLLLDAGGSASGTSEYHQMKLAAILRGLQRMGIAAHNIGGPESELSPDSLRNLQNDTGVKWVSSNLVDHQGKPIGESIVTVKRGGLIIAITGVCDPNLKRHSDIHASDPKASVIRTLQKVTADVKVVLAYLKEPELRELAAALPEVDFVVGGPTGQTMPPTKVGPVQVLSATNKGKFIAKIEIKKRDNRSIETVAIGPVEVSSQLGEDDGQIENLQSFYERLKTRDFTASESGIASSKTPDSREDSYRIAGSQACIKCHTKDCDSWEATKHSHAWSVLTLRKAQFDPYCQQCHATGYGIPGGFENVKNSPDRINVGCENCHGPSSAHVLKPSIRTTFNATQQCIRCHDHENSPEFKYDTYWPKVTHGQKK